jgi:hypothetical protein
VESRPLAGVLMKILGFLLLLSGFAIAFASVTLLAAGGARIAFLIAAMGVEALGLVLLGRAHPLLRGGARG